MSHEPPPPSARDSLQGPDAVLYRIDDRDLLVEVGLHWDDFARDNGAPELVEGALGTSLWDHMADVTTRQLYRRIVERARAGTVVIVPFRCDAPDRTRHMELRIAGLGPERVEFRSRLLRQKERPAQRLLAPRFTATTAEPLRICGWCKRVPVDDEWLEVEEAVERLRLFETEGLPPLSHGICPICEALVSSEVA